jgi:long-subunit acyl-CoA synthetase (AMP-forming)
MTHTRDSNSESMNDNTEHDSQNNWVNNCTLSPPNELILKWAYLRPNDIYLKQVIQRRIKTFTFSEVAEQALKLVSALESMGAQQEKRKKKKR